MMYRPTPSMGSDPWYENFKFFLTYWLLSSNNRDRMGDANQLPPLPPNGTQPPPGFMSPPQKTGSGDAGPHEPSSQQTQPSQPPPSSGHPQNPTPKSPHQISQPPPPPPSSVPNPSQTSWDSLEKSHHHGGSPRLSQNGSHLGALSDGFGSGLGSFKQPPMTSHSVHPMHSVHNPLVSHGNHLGHHMNGPGNSMLPEHIIVDKDRRHVCPHCYKGFRSRQQLNQHNLVHSGVRKYHCLYCERAFKQLSHLQQHHRIHTGEKPYRCPLDGCDKAFAQMSNLQHHMRQHDKATFGQKQCMCPFCDRGYASEKSLKSHLSKMHPDSKIFGLGGQGRSGLPLMDGQGHTIMGGPQTGGIPGGISPHHNTLPMMHPGMKSPLTPPGGPLELTVNSHQRASMGGEKRYSLDSNKGFPMSGNMSSHESKIFQRSLSERLPDRGSHDKLDSMLDQRFGFQNHFRDMNRFGDRSFEPFSPSRLHEMVRQFDFKEIEAKLFDPSMSSEKLQRMAENFSEFRSRFQDQMFRRDGTRQGGFPFEGRNVIQEMNERNAFFNSRNDNMDLGNGRDRYENRASFNGMGISDVDEFGGNRNDLLRTRSRNDMGSRNNLSSPDYSRGRESVSDNMSMNMDAGQLDNRRSSMPMNVRNNTSNADMMIPRSGDISGNHDNALNGNPRQSLMSTADGGMLGLRQNQRARLDTRGSIDSHPAMDQRNGMDPVRAIEVQGGSLDTHAAMETGSDSDILGIRGPRTSMSMNMGNLRMMTAQMTRPDVRSNCNGMLSPTGGMLMSGSRNDNTSTPHDIVEHGSERTDRDYENRIQASDLQQESRHTEFDLMERQNMNLASQDKGKLQNAEEMVVDSNMNIRHMEPDAETMRLQNHSRSMSMGGLCNNMNVRAGNAYNEKQDLHAQNRDVLMQEVNNEMNMSQSANLGQQLVSHHPAQKQTSSDEMMQDGDIDFNGRDDNKNSPTQSLTDPNIIRQRKQRKPTNPQHVFMPSLDHYTSFAADEVEEVNALI